MAIMKTLMKSAILGLFALTIITPTLAQAEIVPFGSFCADERIIYAQDINGITSDDTAFIKDRFGTTLTTAGQIDDDYVIWQSTTVVRVNAGDRIYYVNTQNATRPVEFDVTDLAQHSLRHIYFPLSASPLVIEQDGYLRFNFGEQAVEYTALFLCEGTPPTQTNPTPTPPTTFTPTAAVVNTPPYWILHVPTSEYQTEAGRNINFWVWAEDQERQHITYSVVKMPAGAEFSNQTFSWTPTSSQVGTHFVTFRASDGTYHTDKQVAINVYGDGGSTTIPSSNPNDSGPSSTGNRAPQFVNFNPPLTVVEGGLFFYTAHAIDHDGDAITYTLLEAPAGFLLNATFGSMTWLTSFTDGRIEPYRVTIAASDGKVETRETFTITVIDGVTPPPATTLPHTTTVIIEVPERLQIHNLNVISDDRGAVVVSWETNKISRHRVIYGTESQRAKTGDFTYPNATAESQAATITHSVELEGLEFNTPYYLRAVAKTDGEIAVSDEIIIIRLPDKSITTLGLAALFAALGGFLAAHPVFSVLILTLGILATLWYMRWRKDRVMS